MNVILCPRHGVSMGFATGVGQAKSTALRFLCLSLAKLRVAALSISDFFFKTYSNFPSYLYYLRTLFDFSLISM